MKPLISSCVISLVVFSQSATMGRSFICTMDASRRFMELAGTIIVACSESEIPEERMAIQCATNANVAAVLPFRASIEQSVADRPGVARDARQMSESLEEIAVDCFTGFHFPGGQ